MVLRMEVTAEAAKLLTLYLDEKSALFRHTEAREVLVPWLTYRVRSTFRLGGTLVDLGGGLNLTNAVLAKLGMSVHVVDLLDSYFPHSTLQTDGLAQVEFLEGQGVTFHKTDLTSCDLRDYFGLESVDVVCSYHALEHMHHSPRPMLQSALDVMKSGGTFFCEVPNAVNALKRVRVLLGQTNYQHFHDFWASDVWVGHIREYTVDDLRALSRRLGLVDVVVQGRNWYGTL